MQTLSLWWRWGSRPVRLIRWRLLRFRDGVLWAMGRSPIDGIEVECPYCNRYYNVEIK